MICPEVPLQLWNSCYSKTAIAVEVLLSDGDLEYGVGIIVKEGLKYKVVVLRTPQWALVHQKKQIKISKAKTNYPKTCKEINLFKKQPYHGKRVIKRRGLGKGDTLGHCLVGNLITAVVGLTGLLVLEPTEEGELMGILLRHLGNLEVGREGLEDLLYPLPHADKDLVRDCRFFSSTSKSYRSSTWAWDRDEIASYSPSRPAITALDDIPPWIGYRLDVDDCVERVQLIVRSMA
ncbi:hypothetical protein HAX54_016173 [Datura stramonium]|uniref:Uncharacterized protein n=1 Tax=Datura stramonium TaxID=4076 RepID=A0ABS8UKC0_DATST|nr:hypothetical protein [Datura stramonium]